MTAQDPQKVPGLRAGSQLVPRALLVDDEPAHLEAMEALVRRQGFETRTAASLASARKALKRATTTRREARANRLIARAAKLAGVASGLATKAETTGAISPPCAQSVEGALGNVESLAKQLLKGL